MNLIKLLITTLFFTMIVILLIGNALNIMFILGALVLAGLIWACPHKLDVYTGLKEGFFLGTLIALIYMVILILRSNWFEVSTLIMLVELILLFGISASVGGGLGGLINKRNTD
ncbi:MAG: hypothetical protein K8E24_004980 [Methanobacterium paludis]|jgi:hypothetical protein|uniref:TIGR04086 family membrane protein n=1 Tax=Methanobacterium paludis (strain DSM 25820 / JCM 18151 / SWAN1) TaxID=868131 RepID=F6D5A8_METPW|nr:hypothetical protein [Methanobacterium paludis]AEG18216.1 hypothetical protein MSWAN_1199 [Methanobacterium paludis]MCE7698200.1 hypothetical protein [Methanobacterium paludis]